jgi:glycosyltransferase involved in cell wall biosynthesis
MKSVFLEGSIFSTQIASGISNYLCNLLYYLKGQERKCGFQSKALVVHGYKRNVFIKQKNIQKEQLILQSKATFFYNILTGSLNCPATIFHSPYMFLPPRSEKHINLLTVHDLINFEKEFSVRDYLREKLLKTAIERADHFICISQTTKNKLKEKFPHLDEKRMHVIHQGIDELFIGNQKGSQSGIEIDKPYLLYVGERTGYKNFDSLLKFFSSAFCRKDFNILCVGGGSFTHKELYELHRLDIEKKVKHVGFIATSQLKFLYENAFALAYTSLHEGFGLPIIEALASGCPVLCGDFSSMKEISSKYSILMKDFSPKSFEDAISRIESISTQQKLLAKQYAGQFSWERTANKTLDLYCQLIGP